MHLFYTAEKNDQICVNGSLQLSEIILRNNTSMIDDRVQHSTAIERNSPLISRPHKPKRHRSRARVSQTSSSSSTSSDDEDSCIGGAVSPLPRVRSIEALEYLTRAKRHAMPQPSRRCPPPPPSHVVAAASAYPGHRRQQRKRSSNNNDQLVTTHFT